MITEEAYSLFFKIKLDGVNVWNERNLGEEWFHVWTFINYAILDEENDRVLFWRFCYSPSKEKTDLMHQLESIIKSVTVLKKVIIN
jgi:hypothetical protein